MPYGYFEAAVRSLTLLSFENAAFYTTTAQPGNALPASIALPARSVPKNKASVITGSFQMKMPCESGRGEAPR